MDYSKMTEAELRALYPQPSSPEAEVTSTGYRDYGSMSTDELIAMAQQGNVPEAEGFDTTELIGMGGGLGGALAGAAIGSAVPIVGTAIGAVVGGALGTFGGELVEDYVSDEDLDYMNAVKEAGASVLIDTATLGLGRVLRPAYFSAKRAMGFSPEEVSKEISEHLVDTGAVRGAVGSTSDYATANRLLTEHGGGLRAAQIPKAHAFVKLADNLGSIFMSSRGDFIDHHVKNNEAVRKSVEEMVEATGATPLSTPELGESILHVLSLGKKNSTDLYGKELTAIGEAFSDKFISVSPVHEAFDKLIKDKETVFGSELTKQADDLLRTFREELNEFMPKQIAPTSVMTGKPLYSSERKVPAMDFINWEKSVRGRMAELLDKNKGELYSPTSHQQLTEAMEKITPQILKTLRKSDKFMEKRYRVANKEYSKYRDNLSPKAVKTLIKSAKDRDALSALGGSLLPVGGLNPDKARELVKAVKFAVGSVPKKDLIEAGFKSKDDMMNTIRASFIDRAIPDIADESFDVVKIANKVGKMKPEDLAIARSILGDEAFNKFNAIRGAIRLSSKDTKSDMYSLAIRGREVSSLTNLAGLIGAGGTTYAVSGDPTMTALGGLAFLLAPKVLAKVALSPKLTNRLIKAMAMRGGTEASQKKFMDEISLIVAEVSDVSLDASQE